MIRKTLAAGLTLSIAMLTGLTACGKNNDSSAAAPDSGTQVEAGATGAAVSSMASLDLSQYQSTPSGLRYKVIKEGEGNHPAATDVVLVNYEGKLVDGTVFDSSFQRGEPISFPLNAVIPGWTEGLQLMTPGSVYEFVIPYNLAYGEMGRPPVIPQKADLVFLVELISIQ